MMSKGSKASMYPFFKKNELCGQNVSGEFGR